MSTSAHGNEQARTSAQPFDRLDILMHAYESGVITVGDLVPHCTVARSTIARALSGKHEAGRKVTRQMYEALERVIAKIATETEDRVSEAEAKLAQANEARSACMQVIELTGAGAA